MRDINVANRDVKVDNSKNTNSKKSVVWWILGILGSIIATVVGAWILGFLKLNILL